MNTFISLVDKSPFLAIFFVFWLGFVISFGSCGLVKIPVVFGYVSGASENRARCFLLSSFLAIGLIIGNTAIGMLLVFLKNFGSQLVYMSQYVYYIFGIFLLGTGLFYSGLFKRTRAHGHCEVPKISKKTGLWGALIFGALFTFLEKPSCPCCASALFVIVGVVSLLDSWMYSFLILLSFALGQSASVFLIGSSAGLTRFFTSKMVRVEQYIQFFSGIILILVGIYFIILA